MNAIEFVKKFGLDYAVKLLNYDQSISDHVCQLDFGESENLKQIVEAFELVEKHGGINEAIEATGSYYIKPSDWEDLNNAINLVEQCQND